MLWNCYFYVTDGNRVYPMFVQDEDHIVSRFVDFVLATDAVGERTTASLGLNKKMNHLLT